MAHIVVAIDLWILFAGQSSRRPVWPQAVTTLPWWSLECVLNRLMLQGADLHGPVQWGKISVRGMVGLFGLAAAFTWVMGLMGYIRSSGRLAWHVNELMSRYRLPGHSHPRLDSPRKWSPSTWSFFGGPSLFCSGCASVVGNRSCGKNERGKGAGFFTGSFA